VSRFLSRSSRLIETFGTNQDKSRFFEIFVGNRDFVEINQDFVEINQDFVETFSTFFGLSKQKFEFPTLFAHFEANFEAKK
jgi:hypothetical protein